MLLSAIRDAAGEGKARGGGGGADLSPDQLLGAGGAHEDDVLLLEALRLAEPGPVPRALLLKGGGAGGPGAGAHDAGALRGYTPHRAVVQLEAESRKVRRRALRAGSAAAPPCCARVACAAGGEAVVLPLVRLGACGRACCCRCWRTTGGSSRSCWPRASCWRTGCCAEAQPRHLVKTLWPSPASDLSDSSVRCAHVLGALAGACAAVATKRLFPACLARLLNVPLCSLLCQRHTNAFAPPSPLFFLLPFLFPCTVARSRSTHKSSGK